MVGVVGVKVVILGYWSESVKLRYCSSRRFDSEVGLVACELGVSHNTASFHVLD